MKRKLVSLAVLFMLGATLSYGAEGGDWKGWYQTFLKSLKYKIEKRITPKSQLTAVAAVRGAKKEDKSSNLYWKGSSSQKAQAKIDSEQKTIKESVETALNGDVEKARTQLSDFIAKNPDSYFINEAREALEKLPPGESESKEIKGNEDKADQGDVKPESKEDKAPEKKEEVKKN